MAELPSLQESASHGTATSASSGIVLCCGFFFFSLSSDDRRSHCRKQKRRFTDFTNPAGQHKPEWARKCLKVKELGGRGGPRLPSSRLPSHHSNLASLIRAHKISSQKRRPVNAVGQVLDRSEIKSGSANLSLPRGTRGGGRNRLRSWAELKRSYGVSKAIRGLLISEGGHRAW